VTVFSGGLKSHREQVERKKSLNSSFSGKGHRREGAVKHSKYEE